MIEGLFYAILITGQVQWFETKALLALKPAGTGCIIHIIGQAWVSKERCSEIKNRIK